MVSVFASCFSIMGDVDMRGQQQHKSPKSNAEVEMTTVKSTQLEIESGIVPCLWLT